MALLQWHFKPYLIMYLPTYIQLIYLLSYSNENGWSWESNQLSANQKFPPRNMIRDN